MVTVSNKAKQMIAKKRQELHPATVRALNNDDINIGHSDVVLPCETEVLSGGMAQLRKFLNQAPIYDNLNKSTLDVLKKAVNDPDNIVDFRWVLVKRDSLGYDFSNLQKKKELGYVEITKQDLKPDMQHVALEKQTSEGKMIAMMCISEHRLKRLAVKNQQATEIFSKDMQDARLEMNGRADIKTNQTNIDIGNYG
jgi:hypothetical protein